jgi:uncharacterized repeat protein (TIGR02543 family)
MKKITRKLLYVLLMVVVISGMLLFIPGSLYADDDNEHVATPTFTPPAGPVDSGTGVTIATTTPGAHIHYTIDGTDPTDSSPEYTGAITITLAVTIKAFADKDGVSGSDVDDCDDDCDWEKSATATASYTINTYSVTYIGNGETGGTVPVDGASYASGDNVAVLGNTGSLVKTGFVFSGWDNGGGTVGDTFVMPAANTTLSAVWTAETTPTPSAVYTITATAEGPGAITNPGVFVISNGQSLLYSMAPDGGASIVDVLVNGVSVGAVSPYTFLNVNSNQTIRVIFASGGGGGEVAVAAITEPVITVLAFTGIDPIIPITGGSVIVGGLGLFMASFLRKIRRNKK